jgi:thymidylate kinase
MKEKIYFITGVCGVGKSAIIPFLKKYLSQDKYDVRDFDERGVPDGADHEWRKSEVKKWLAIGTSAAQRGISTIICGFAKRRDFEGTNILGIPKIEIILLDANAETIRKRLVNRYTKNGVFDQTQNVIGKPVNEFIESNVWYCKTMEKECREDGCEVIDTSKLSIEEVAKEAVKLIKD